MYSWLFDGITIEADDIKQTGGQSSFRQKMEQVYKIRVEHGRENPAAFSAAPIIDQPDVEMCDQETIYASQTTYIFAVETHLKSLQLDDLIVFVRKVEDWL